MVVFRNIDDTIIKPFNIESFYSIYDNELKNLFNNSEIIRVNIPLNYSIILRYSFNNDLSIFGKIIELNNGVYDIYKYTSNKIINQIDIINMIYNNKLVMTNIGIPYYWDKKIN
jgi:hypothetical protein